MKELSIDEWLFVGAFIRDRNCARAYRASHPGYTGTRSGSLGWDIMMRPHVKAEINRTLQGLTADVGLTKEMVKQDIVNVLNADPRELFNVQTGACRHCHGIDHLWQRTTGEMNRDRYAFDCDPLKVGHIFDMRGGIGFDAYADPHVDCPECNGKGEQRIRLTDTRMLSPEAASLLQSIEQTKNGIKITTRSKDTAREAAARLLGLNKDNLEISGTIKMEDWTDEQLVALVAKELGKI